jgi:putative ABC transport system permease protein
LFLVFLKELLANVLSSLMRNKLRSFLTMAGIAWGVASIVLIVALGEGFKKGQRDELRTLGENVVILFPGRTERQAGGQRAGKNIHLTYEDVGDIRSECFRVRTVVGELQNQVRATSPFNNGRFSALGVEPQYPQIRTIPIARGRFLTEADNANAVRVAVLGDNVRKKLFGERPVEPGDSVMLNGLPFRIGGLMPAKTQNASYNGMDSDKIFIPYSTMLRDMPPSYSSFRPGSVGNIIYTPVSLDESRRAREQVMRVLARNHDFDPGDKGAVYVWDTMEDVLMIDGIFTSMTYFLGTIAVITLSLGGVSVMNIMLISVAERTQEIGLRKAVGAKRSRILLDYLLEGMLLAIVSGLGGWAISYGIASAVNALPKQQIFGGLPVSGTTTAIAFAALGVIAVASAICPAWRAASLTPVQALSHER